MTHEEREQALSEEDYIELRNRFGTVVESVVRDMVSGKGERWEQAQADEEYISKNILKEKMQYYGFHAPDMTITEFIEDELPSVAIPNKNTETQGDDRWLLHFGQNMAIPSAQDDDYVMIKRTTWEKIEKALDSVSARGC